MTFLNLTEGLRWAEDHWGQQRPAPVRLHTAHSTEGALGAPRFTGAFLGALDGSPMATDDALRTVACHHPMLRTADPRDCPECYGLGLKDVRQDRYRFPMTLALSRLSKVLRQRRHPHPYWQVVALAEHGWDPRVTARAMDLPWELAEALFLRALRQLHARYEEGPISGVRWSEKSQAQQQAEAVA